MEVRFAQFLKAPASITFTELGMVMEVKESQPPKAPFPIHSTEFGMVMFGKALQSAYLEVIDYQLFVVNTVEKWIGCYLWVYGK